MVYKKYIWVNGKRYGPYLYHNKRVNGKVVTSYHGSHDETEEKLGVGQKKYLHYVLIIALAMMFIATGALFLYDDSGVMFAPGQESIVFEQSSYQVGNPLFATVEIPEIPLGATVTVQHGEKEEKIAVPEITSFIFEFELSYEEELMREIPAEKIESPSPETESKDSEPEALQKDEGVDESDSLAEERTESVDDSMKESDLPEGSDLPEEKSVGVDDSISESDFTGSRDSSGNGEASEKESLGELGGETKPASEQNRERDSELSDLEIALSPENFRVVVPVTLTQKKSSYMFKSSDEAKAPIDVISLQINGETVDQSSFSIERTSTGLSVTPLLRDVSLELPQFTFDGESPLAVRVEHEGEILAEYVADVPVADISSDSAGEGEIVFLTPVSFNGEPVRVRKTEQGPLDRVEVPIEATDISLRRGGEEVPAVVAQETLDQKEISVRATDDEIVEYEYTLPAPTLRQEKNQRGNIEVVVSGSSEFSNVEAFVPLNSFDLEKFKYVVEVATGDRVDVEVRSNGIAWNVPTFSEHQYEIILISAAEHLDSNREFIADIFAEVQEQDGVWSSPISDGEYVRATFEELLDNTKDITIYPRVVSGTPVVEVYAVNSEELLAIFDPLVENAYNTIFLTSLVGQQDTFDLRVSGGSVEFDHIIDPTIVFTTENIRGLDSAVLDARTFVQVWCVDNGEVGFAVYDVNGSLLSSQLDIDPGLTAGCGEADDQVAVTSINEDEFAIAYALNDGTVQLKSKIFDRSGSELDSFVVDTAIGSDASLSLTALNDEDLAFAWHDFSPDGIKFVVRDIGSGSQSGAQALDGPSGVSLSLSSLNETAFVAAWIDGDSAPDVRSVIVNNGVRIPTTDIIHESDVGSRGQQVAVSALNDSSYVIAWQTSFNDPELHYRVVHFDQAESIEVLASFGEDKYSSLDVAALDSETYALLWYQDAAGSNDDIRYSIHNVDGVTLVDNLVLDSVGSLSESNRLIASSSLEYTHPQAELAHDLYVLAWRSGQNTESLFEVYGCNEIGCPYIPLFECGTLDVAGGIYVLQNDISIQSGNCFDIVADDITLDGNRYGIIRAGGGLFDTAIYAFGRNNITIQNFGNISEFGKGIFLESTDNSFAINNSFNNDLIHGPSAVYLKDSQSTQILSNKFLNGWQNYIDSEDSSHSIIFDNLFSEQGTSTSNAIYLRNLWTVSENASIFNNTFANISGTGINVVGSSGGSHNILDNRYLDISGTSHYIEEDHNVVLREYIQGNSFYSYLQFSGNNNTFESVTFDTASSNNYDIQVISSFPPAGTNYLFDIVGAKRYFLEGRLVVGQRGLSEIVIDKTFTSVEGLNYSYDLQLTDNSVYINSTSILNASANITISNLSGKGITNAIILRDSALCNPAICTVLVPFDGDAITFNVTGWSTYSVSDPALLDDENAPGINFTVPPTPQNGTDIFTQNFTVNTTISDQNDVYTFVNFNDDLLAWYQFDNESAFLESDTFVYDHSGSGNNLTGTAHSISDFGIGGSYGFDGETDTFYYQGGPGYAESNIHRSFRDTTFSFWFYTEDLPGSAVEDKQTIFQLANYIKGVTAYLSGDQLYVTARGGFPGSNGGWEGTYLSTGSIQPNQWYHVAIVINETTLGAVENDRLLLYLDGSLVASGPAATIRPSVSPPNTLSIGSAAWGAYFHDEPHTIGNIDDYYYNGSIGDFLIIDRSLEQEQIEALALSQRESFEEEYFATRIGTQTYQGCAVDASGNMNCTEEWQVELIDVEPPAISWVSPPTPPIGQSVLSEFTARVATSDLSDVYSFIDFEGDLKLWMRMDELSGSTFEDLSSAENDGLIVGDVIQSPDGWGSYSAEFDGVGDSIEVFGLTNLGDSFTISARIKPDVITDDTVIIADTLGFGNKYQLYVDSQQQLVFRHYAFEIDEWVAFDTLIPVGIWTHVFVSFENGSPSIFIDGVQQPLSPRSFPYGFEPATDARIGSRNPNAGSSGFDGLIDEVLVFDRALTQSEAVALYSLDETTYDVVFDGLFAETQYDYIAHSVDAVGLRNATEIRSIMTQEVVGVCQELSSPNTIYELQSDIIVPSGTCLNITADNITLEGRGHSVRCTDCSLSGVGVFVDGVRNFESQNIVFENFYTGIELIAADDIRLINTSSLNALSLGLYSSGTNEVSITESFFRGSASHNALFTLTQNISITSSEFSYSSSNGLVITPGTFEVSLLFNNISANDGAGVVANAVTTIFASSNHFDSNEIGIRIAANIEGDTFIVEQNTFENHPSQGIYITGSAGDLDIEDNLFVNNTYGAFIESSNNIFLSDNNFTNSTLASIFIGVNSYDNVFRNQYIIDENSGFAILDESGDATENYFLFENEYALVNWSDSSPGGFLRNLTLNGSFDSVVLADNSAFVNVSGIQGAINSDAIITLYGIGDRGFENPSILRDGATCLPTICTALTSLIAQDVVFTVTGFSNYSIGEDSSIQPPSIAFDPSTPQSGGVPGSTVTINVSSFDGDGHYVFTNIDDHLVGWWRFDSVAGGVAIDNSSFGNDGTVAGIDIAPGYWNYSYEFDGGVESISLGDQSFLSGADEFSLSVWVYHDSLSTDDDVIFSTGTALGGPSTPFALWKDENGATDRYAISVHDGLDGSGILYTDTPVIDEAWTHVAVVFRGGESVSVFINGVEDSASQFDTSIVDFLRTGTYSYLIGGGSMTQVTYRFLGKIDDLLLFDRALTSDEILSLYSGNENQYEETITFPPANRTFQAYAVDRFGNTNQTQERSVFISVIEICDGSPIDVGNTEYALLTDLTDVSGTCLNVTADNVTIQGNGFTIDGNAMGSDYGVVFTGARNGTVLNMSITEFGTGVGFIGANESLAHLLNISGNSQFGFHLLDAINNSVKNNTIEQSSIAMNVAGSDTNLIQSNLINATSSGILLNSESNGNDIFENTFADLANTGIIFVTDSRDNLLLNNNFVSIGVSLIVDNVAAYSNYLVYNNSFGEIRWIDNSPGGFLTDLDIGGAVDLVFGEDIIIEENYVWINDSLYAGGLSKANSSANITLYGLDQLGLFDPGVIWNDDIICDETTQPSCYNHTELDIAEVVFNVSSWDGNYTIKRISNQLPTVNLLFPLNESYNLIDRTPSFQFVGTDPDGNSDIIGYEFNLTLLPGGVTTCTESSRLITIPQLIQGVQTYELGSDVLCLNDNDHTYAWSVRACDLVGCGPWSQVWEFGVDALVQITLTSDTISFGTLSPGDTADTDSVEYAPFVIENSGNAPVNVSLYNATDLWHSSGYANPTPNFMIKADTQEIGAFDEGTSEMSYFEIPSELQFASWHATGENGTHLITDLRYIPTADDAQIDVYISVPPNELPGSRQTNLTFLARFSGGDF